MNWYWPVLFRSLPKLLKGNNCLMALRLWLYVRHRNSIKKHFHISLSALVVVILPSMLCVCVHFLNNLHSGVFYILCITQGLSVNFSFCRKLKFPLCQAEQPGFVLSGLAGSLSCCACCSLFCPI